MNPRRLEYEVTKPLLEMELGLKDLVIKSCLREAFLPDLSCQLLRLPHNMWHWLEREDSKIRLSQRISERISALGFEYLISEKGDLVLARRSISVSGLSYFRMRK